MELNFKRLRNSIRLAVCKYASLGCNNQTYTVTGTITKDNGNQNYNGYSPISLKATNPMPGVPGEGCTIATYATLTGDIENEGCDLVGPSSAILSTNLVPSSSTSFTKASDIPTGENSTFEGWSSQYDTVAQWKGSLLGSASYDGRQVTESNGSGTYSDTCFFTGSAVPKASLSGGIWNVGFYINNAWDDDYVGYSEASVTYYRQNFRPPCATHIPQAMSITVQGDSNYTTIYTQGWVGFGIPDQQHVTSLRDGNEVEEVWP